MLMVLADNTALIFRCEEFKNRRNLMLKWKEYFVIVFEYSQKIFIKRTNISIICIYAELLSEELFIYRYIWKKSFMESVLKRPSVILDMFVWLPSRDKLSFRVSVNLIVNLYLQRNQSSLFLPLSSVPFL